MQCAVGLLSTFPSVIGTHRTRAAPEFFMEPDTLVGQDLRPNQSGQITHGLRRVEKRMRSHSPTLICIEAIYFSYNNLLQNSECHLEQLLRLHCFGQEV